MKYSKDDEKGFYFWAPLGRGGSRSSWLEPRRRSAAVGFSVIWGNKLLSQDFFRNLLSQIRESYLLKEVFFHYYNFGVFFLTWLLALLLFFVLVFFFN